MPTGYTCKLMEKGETFQEFVMRCARAMGALIEMRDQSLDAKIPEWFKPSDYHAKEFEKAKERVAMLSKMNAKHQEEFGEEEKAQDIKHWEASLARQKAENARLYEMEAKVNQWTPPSSDHIPFKEFMLQQLRDSENNIAYDERNLARANEAQAIEYYRGALEKAQGDIRYHIEHNVEEVKRVENQNRWLQQLRESLK